VIPQSDFARGMYCGAITYAGGQALALEFLLLGAALGGIGLFMAWRGGHA
jgi:hypothetical protein